MNKIKIYGTIGGLLLCSSSLAADSSCNNVLPQVNLQLRAEQWVTTQTAEVSVALDALLNKEQVAKAQDNFQAALKKIAPEGQWHITEFTRSAGKTSLEQLHAVAQARLGENSLAGLRERATAQNSEGQTYSVQDIVYTPTTDEISAAQAKLRAQIYDQTKAELGRLNGVYPKPGYVLYSINFYTPAAPMPVTTMLAKAGEAAPGQPATSTTLSQKLTQDAGVTLAAPPGALCGH